MTTGEGNVALPIASIRPCRKSSDYRDLTESLHPIVVQSPDACQCIDGWNLIEQAQAEGISTVAAMFLKLMRIETELAIRKVAIRTKPLGGTCLYAELVRNTCMFTILCRNAPMMVVFSHGGNRRSALISLAKGKTTSGIFFERLGRSQTTINKYLQHGEHVSDGVTKELIDANVPKGFFEATQKEKQWYAAELTSQQTASDEIIRLVSRKNARLAANGANAHCHRNSSFTKSHRAASACYPARAQPHRSSPPSRQPCEFRIPEAPEPLTDDSASTEDESAISSDGCGSELMTVANKRSKPPMNSK